MIYHARIEYRFKAIDDNRLLCFEPVELPFASGLQEVFAGFILSSTLSKTIAFCLTGMPHPGPFAMPPVTAAAHMFINAFPACRNT